jgi:hypothetical protein
MMILFSKTFSKIYILICIAAITATLAFKTPFQEIEWKKLWSISIKGNKLFTDNLGNSFLINKDLLTKYRENGTLFRTYSNKGLGTITSIDALNPLKIVVFYQDFSKVVFLDNTVTENGFPIQLQDREWEQTSLVCASYDNGIWLFDQVQFNLIRLNQQLQITTQIKNLNQILNLALQPVFMMEHENFLYMSIPEIGIFQFDIFGTYIKTIPIKGLSKFQVFNNILYYSNTPGTLNAYSIKTLQESTISLPISNYIDLRIEKSRLYLLHNDSLSVYQFPEN